MTDYTKTTDFAAKDALLAGNPSKIVKGTEIDTEFTNIQTAIATKYDNGDTIPIANGGTGATSASAARTALGSTTVGDAVFIAASAAAGRTALVAAASGANTDITSLSAVTSINGGQLAGLRNRIINGAGQIAQRGNVAAVNNTVVYGGCDRTAVALAGFTTGSGTIQQSAAGFGSLGYSQAVTGVTTTGAGTIQFIHRIESLNIKDANSKTITIQAKFFQNTGGALNCGFVLYKANTVDNFTGITLVSTGATTSVSSGSLTTVTTTFTLGASDCTNGLQVMPVFNGVGAVTSKDFHVTDFQLELGSVATEFEHRPYGMELALCQRYYQVHTIGEQAGYLAVGNVRLSSLVLFPVAMRVAPTRAVVTAGTSTNVRAPDTTYAGLVFGVTATSAICSIEATGAGQTGLFNRVESLSAEL